MDKPITFKPGGQAELIRKDLLKYLTKKYLSDKKHSQEAMTEEDTAIDDMIAAFRSRNRLTLTQLMEVEIDEQFAESRPFRMDTEVRKPICCCTGTMFVRMQGSDFSGL